MHPSISVPILSLLSLLFLLTPLTATQDIDSNDLPSQCRTICDPIVALTSRCDREDNGDGDRRLNCVCNGTDAAAQIPVCAACVAFFDPNDGDDNGMSYTSCSSSCPAAKGDRRYLDVWLMRDRTKDVYDIVTSCSFSSTTYNPTSTAAATSSTSITTITSASTTVVTTTDAAGSGTTATSEVVMTIQTSVPAEPSQTDSAAAVRGGVGIVVGIVGVAGGLVL